MVLQRSIVNGHLNSCAFYTFRHFGFDVPHLLRPACSFDWNCTICHSLLSSWTNDESLLSVVGLLPSVASVLLAGRTRLCRLSGKHEDVFCARDALRSESPLALRRAARGPSDCERRRTTVQKDVTLTVSLLSFLPGGGRVRLNGRAGSRQDLADHKRNSGCHPTRILSRVLKPDIVRWWELIK